MKIDEYSDLTKEAIDYIKFVCDTYGPRISGSIEEKNALEDLEERLKPISDFTYFDSYKVHPTFYPGGFVTIFGILVILGVFTFFFKGLLALFSLFLPLIGLFIFFVPFGIPEKYLLIHFFNCFLSKSPAIESVALFGT